MKIKYEQSFRDDLPGNIVVDYENGEELVIVPCPASEAADMMAAMQRDWYAVDLNRAEN